MTKIKTQISFNRAKIIVNIGKQYQQRTKEKGTYVDNQKLGVTHEKFSQNTSPEPIQA
jgi:hypothetical protein